MKRRIAGLHQNTAISSVELTDHWEPKAGAAWGGWGGRLLCLV